MTNSQFDFETFLEENIANDSIVAMALETLYNHELNYKDYFDLMLEKKIFCRDMNKSSLTWILEDLTLEDLKTVFNCFTSYDYNKLTCAMINYYNDRYRISPDILEFLIEKGANIQDSDFVFNACFNYDVSSLEFIIKSGIEYSKLAEILDEVSYALRDMRFTKYEHVLENSKNFLTVKYVIKNFGSNINHTDLIQRSLKHAIFCRDYENIMYFLNKGAKIRSVKKTTPMLKKMLSENKEVPLKDLEIINKVVNEDRSNIQVWKSLLLEVLV